MSLIALVSNPRSDGNAGKAALAAFAAGLPGVLACAPATPAELAEHLKEFARQGVSAIAVDGGDGTLREVLTAMPGAFGDQCPPVALLPSGKTNLAARDVGSFGRGPEGLQRLIQAARNGWAGARWAERSTLEVVWRDDPSKVIRGILFGAAAFAHATRMAGLWAHDRGLKQQAAVAISIIRMFVETLRGHTEAVTDLAVAEGDTAIEAPRASFLMMATTARKLMLGFWPFPSPAADTVHWVEVAHPPHRLSHALWRAWRNRLFPKAGPGYRGGRCPSLTVMTRQPFVIDGELYHPGPEGVVLRAGPTIRFVSG